MLDDTAYESLLIGPPDAQGSLFKSNKKAYVDSVLNKNKNIDWIKRLYEPNAPSIQVPGEPYRSTHLMADDGKGYVYPTIIRQSDGTLKKLSEDDAYDYAKKTNTGIQLPKDAGTWFAANGYKIGTGVNNDILPNGQPINNPGVTIDNKGNLKYPEKYVNSTPVMQRSSTIYIPQQIKRP